jgi:formylglycine-generating enzyme required for sulfatase activity
MIYIPAGDFVFGPLTLPIFKYQAGAWVSNGIEEIPRTDQIFLDGFWIDKYEVTVGAYKKCIEDGSCKVISNWSKEGSYLDCTIAFDKNFHYLPNKDQYPMNCLTTFQAAKYCAWAGKRLPTVFEWTKAARGPYPDERIHPWGDQLPNCTLTRFNNDGAFGGCDSEWPYSIPVGTTQDISPYGVYDLAGNVREYTMTWFDRNWFLNEISTANPEGPDGGDGLIHIGGSWAESEPTNINWIGLDFQLNKSSHAQGFRCVADFMP